MATSFHQNARCPHIGLKEGGEDVMLTGGLLPFPRTGCALLRVGDFIALAWRCARCVSAQMTSEVPLCKGATRTRLQIPLEMNGSLLVGEFADDVKLPGTATGRVWAAAGV